MVDETSGNLAISLQWLRWIIYFMVIGIEEKDEKIPKEKAVCKFCYNIFEDDNVLKTKCKCKFTLIHEECAVIWSREKGNNKCHQCDENIYDIYVTLSRADKGKLIEKPVPHKRSCNWIGRFVGKA
ncbi:hypothetical protein Pfo_026675 [Paulownia fortunei]|nr:hypothetical protein Pfo_026675 [Paulownia fortunei]